VEGDVAPYMLDPLVVEVEVAEPEVTLPVGRETVVVAVDAAEEAAW
jgi:hypothetical protein